MAHAGLAAKYAAKALAGKVGGIGIFKGQTKAKSPAAAARRPRCRRSRDWRSALAANLAERQVS